MSVELFNNNGLVSHFGIEQRIFVIRGIQVMIDRDLAELYGVEPKRLGEQVRRNIERFPEIFRFQLTDTEKNQLVANCDRFEPLKHSSVPPYAFTKQGVAMPPLNPPYKIGGKRAERSRGVDVQIMRNLAGLGYEC